jgi:4-amino-4-deoxy-L-arabinose transferase-like glycosyltransferase
VALLPTERAADVCPHRVRHSVTETADRPASPGPDEAGRTATSSLPAWQRVAPLAVGLLAAVVCLWNLEISGYANTYYSAAAQAAGQSWTAMFFGSIDAGNFITVDKPPLSLWVIGLSVRALGLSPLSVLLPEALAGIAAVLVLHATVRRTFGSVAAFIAGVAFALTPVAALMFRYNNPDAVLTLLLVAAAWALVRGLEDERFRWPVLAAALVGLAFLTKYLQAYLVLPAFALTWLLAARGDLRHRLVVLVAAGITVVVTSFWWIAIVDLLPPASRPYIGGSTNNTAMDLVLGYDGLGRIFGEAGPGGGAPGRSGVPGLPGLAGGKLPFAGSPGAGFGGTAGWLRMFNAEWAGEISWLLTPAAVGLLAGLATRARAPRTDPRRAGFVLWGTWGLVHVLVFSLMSGIVHSYYAVAIAPAAAALLGGGLVELWRLRARFAWGGLVLGGTFAATAWWAWQVLARTPSFFPGVGLAALIVVLAAALVLAVPPAAGDRYANLLMRGAGVAGVAAILVGPALYTVDTTGRAISGGDPSAGPAATADGRGPGGFPGFVGDPGGTNRALVDYLVANRGDATWLVAVSSANQAGPLQLASGIPVMAMGGFMGGDPAPTLDQLQGYVREGRLRFVMLGGPGGAGGPVGFGGPGGFFGGDGIGSVAGERSAWVAAACTPVTLGGVGGALYDCSGAG